MLTKLFLVFATAAKFALPAVNAQGSESHDQRRSPKTEAGFSPVPPPITGGDPTLGDVFGYYNYPRIQIGSPVENPEMDAGLSEFLSDGRIAHEPHPVTLERRKKQRDPIKTEVELTGHEISSDDGEVIYTGEIKIGGNVAMQTFTVKFDTGSSDTWISWDECKAIQRRQKEVIQQEKKRKNVWTSNPARGEFLPKHGVSGFFELEAKGEKFRSPVTIGDLSLNAYIFGCVSDTTSRFNAMPFVGIVGLAFPYLNADKHLSPLLDFAYQGGYIAGVFALRITKKDSRLYIGSIGDTNLFDKDRLVYYDVKVSRLNENGLGVYSHWMLENGKIKVHGTEMVSNIYAFFVSGMRRIYGPPEDVLNIYNQIPTSRFQLTPANSIIHYFSCTQEFTLSFSWDNEHEWVFNRQSFTIKEKNGWCIGAIQTRPSIKGNRWMLGTSFMEIAHTVYELPSAKSESEARLGLAPYKQQAGGH